MIPAPPKSNPGDEPWWKSLERMSDDELMREEDRVMLADEFNLFRRYTRWSAGRMLLLALSAVYFALTLLVMDRLRDTFGPKEGNILLIIPYVGALAIGAGLAHLTWKVAGPTLRTAMRTAMHYWPVTLWAGLVILQLVAFLKA